MDQYVPLYYAIGDVEDGMPVREAVERTRDRFPAEGKEQKALMRSPAADLIVALSVVYRHSDEGETVPSDALDVARALVKDGRMPKRAKKPAESPQRSLL